MNWTSLQDEDLLKLRIRNLNLHLEDSPLYGAVAAVLHELEEKGLTFKPRLYLGDEWFSPSDTCAVAIPFFLSHPRLRQLEKRMMLECEGDSPEEFAKLLRHELGHAFDHAFKVSKRRKWRTLFGSPNQEYHPESYRPRPYSKNFVQNIPRWYAQAHPDEDFAETFAVWLDPKSNWREYYQDWGAIKKLEYVNELCEEHKGMTIAEPKGRMISDARFLQSTLEHYYTAKKKIYAENYPDFYDPDLLKIFTSDGQGLSAYKFMRDHRKEILKSISLWTNEKKVTVQGLLDRLTTRCHELKLKLNKNESATLIAVSTFLTTLVSSYLFTGHFKRKI